MSGGRGKRNTRHASGDLYGGSFCDLPVADLATHRQVIQACYFEKKQGSQLTNREVCKLVAEKLIKVWNNANPRITLLGDKTIINKVDNLHNVAQSVNHKKAKKVTKTATDLKLDKLFDIGACKCSLPVVTCSDVKCRAGTCEKVHIKCTCPAEIQVKSRLDLYVFSDIFLYSFYKVPELDREFLLDQRNKTGPHGRFQIGPLDKKEARRVEKSEKRKLKDEENLVMRKKKTENELAEQFATSVCDFDELELLSDKEEEEEDGDKEEDIDMEEGSRKDKVSEQNRAKLTNFSLECDRYFSLEIHYYVHLFN